MSITEQVKAFQYHCTAKEMMTYLVNLQQSFGDCKKS